VVGFLSGTIEVFAKIIAGTVALAFWLTFGLAAWLRVLLVALTTYTLQLTFAPFSGQSASADHLHHAIYFWKQGFDQILRSLFGRPQPAGAAVVVPGDPAQAAAEQRAELSFWAGLWGFLKELAFTLIFWGAIAVAAHFAGVLRLPALAQFDVERTAPGEPRTRSPAKTERPQIVARAEPIEREETVRRVECETEGEPQTLAPDTRYRAKREVNVRAGPTTRSRNLGKLAGGEVVTGVATVGADWLMVSNERFGGCYVATRYFQRAE